MNIPLNVNQTELLDVLLNVAVTRPVFIWGAPGIGKSSIVENFARSLDIPCVSMLGSQLAPEDIIGVPQIVDGKSVFCPPRMIARDEPYCLFLDELNACSQEVQKAFYSLIHDSAIINGDQKWPNKPEDRDALYFLAQSFKAQLIKELPNDKNNLSGAAQDLAFRAKSLIKDLANISLEIAQMTVSSEDDNTAAGLACGRGYSGFAQIGGEKIMSKAKQRQKEQNDIATQKFKAGCQMVDTHPLFYALWQEVSVRRDENNKYPADGLCFATSDGYILCNPKRRAEPEQWARALAHCLLHLGMEHFKEKEHPILWNMACDCVVEKFLADLKFGTPAYETALPNGIHDEERLYRRLLESAEKKNYTGFGTAGEKILDMLFVDEPRYRWHSKPPQWPKLFAFGLSAAVRSAVRVASGEQEALSTDSNASVNSIAYRAKQWFISSYPLLGAIAANFMLIEDPLICQRMEITVAAVSPALSEIYINPAFHLDTEEIRFVMAHEFLHAALRHDARQEWRDAYLWNVACDYVINQWLTEMGVGERPNGLLYDEQFKGMNAEAIYDRIVIDMRTYRKLATLRGIGVGDILPGARSHSADVDLDGFYRRALSQGLSYHQEQERGYLPEGLIEEIRALSHPPIPWDVELARWFDEQFTPIEKTRSYARPSRRQSSTPDIPRPNWVVSQAALDGRTFGVVLDTSGSMERGMLATALGAIASYSAARDVPAARVVFCDAEAYDAGYMKPEDIAGTVKVKGRGGTILQPGIDLLDETEDFPKEAPILIVTDGYCDKVILHGREHAFLVPHGANLPFVPMGKVFRMR